MKPKDPEPWRKLCQQASMEQDPEKLAVLVAEIVRILDEKLPENYDRLKSGMPSSNPDGD